MEPKQRLRSGDGVRVRLLQAGAPVAAGVVDELNDDGIHVRAAVPLLAPGTYVEVEAGPAGGWIGAMVERCSSQGVRLIFASWSPQLFELIQRVAKAAHTVSRVAARSQA